MNPKVLKFKEILLYKIFFVIEILKYKNNKLSADIKLLSQIASTDYVHKMRGKQQLTYNYKKLSSLQFVHNLYNNIEKDNTEKISPQENLVLTRQVKKIKYTKEKKKIDLPIPANKKQYNKKEFFDILLNLEKN